MKLFWDTSAVINAAVSAEVFKRREEGENLSRLHMLNEFFSTMTGRSIETVDTAGNAVRVTFSADDAAEWLAAFCEGFLWVDLDPAEWFEAFRRAGRIGIQGGAVYDYGHALAAIKGGADIVLTRNPEHFNKGRIGAAALAWP